MPNPLLKAERYTNLGGINTKVSVYENTAFEFLNLVNLDFQTPAALTQRWGSTQYVGQTFSGAVNSVFEFAQLNGASQIMIGSPGGIWGGSTTGLSQGLSLTTQSATLFSYAVICNTAFSFSALISNPVPTGARYFGPNGLGYYGGFGNGTAGDNFYIAPENQSNNEASFAVMNNFLFIADGDKFVKYDGSTTYFVGLPPPLAYSVTCMIGAGSSLGFTFGQSFGVYYFYANYVNNRGFNGPVFPIGSFNANTQLGVSSLVGPSIFYGNYIQFSYNFYTPLGFGITSINIFTYYDPTGGATYPAGLASYVQNNMWTIATPIFLSSNLTSGSTQSPILFNPIDTNGGLTNIISNIGEISQVPGYLPLGLTTILQNTIGGATHGPQAIIGYYPSILEIHTISFSNQT